MEGLGIPIFSVVRGRAAPVDVYGMRAGGPGGTKPVMGHVLFRVSRVRDLRLRVCLRFPLKIVGSGI